MTATIHGITYSLPTVVLLQEAGIGTSEIAARTCYDSFESSENIDIQSVPKVINYITQDHLDEINAIEHSALLDKLAWTHFHHSILEHANLTYLIKGTSRGVLQEQARHRIQAISVRSTRYTMQDILHAFNACSVSTLGQAKREFYEIIQPMNMFVVCGTAETVEIHTMYDKLHHQLLALGGSEFGNISMGKSAKAVFAERKSYDDPKALFAKLIVCASKRNVGDPFKWIVSDNWKVDMVVTFNLRSLKNYFDLRDSGAAFFQIQWLAKAMKEVTPSKYLDLIIKPTKDTK